MDYLAQFRTINSKNFVYLNTDKQHAKVTGKGVKVAIIDGSASIKFIPDVIPVNYKVDQHYHGTTVGLIIKTIAPDIELYGICIYEGNENQWDLEQALDWCIENNIQLVNVSMSLGRSEERNALIHKALEHGVILSVAVGNNGNKPERYPASLPDTISVVALDSKLDTYAGYSCSGEGVEICFPGSYWAFTMVDPVKQMPTDGTSFASPGCVGSSALYFEAFKTVNGRFPTIDELRNQFLYKYAIDIHTPGKDLRTGYGKFIFPDPEKWIDEIPRIVKPKYYKVQCGAFRIKENAMLRVQMLKELGFSTYLPPVGLDGIYRVQIGAFSIKENADKLKASLIEAGIVDAFIVYV